MRSAGGGAGGGEFAFGLRFLALEFGEPRTEPEIFLTERAGALLQRGGATAQKQPDHDGGDGGGKNCGGKKSRKILGVEMVQINPGCVP